ncbi:MAG TPA: peptidoglycan DD-metalloendopeptidase family protein [Candidatus Enterocola sp.]|nr:peptidoglycan DD-metalloendopeptidase family protein [Candidatus Enterocola sp.]
MKRIIILFIECFILTLSINAQSVDELQKRKERAMKNLEMTSNLISETKETTAKTMTKVNLLSAEIKERKVVINSLNAEINGINQQLSRLRSEATAKQKALESIKKEYAALMYHQYYKKGNFDKLMFVLSAGNFAESYRRYRYMQQYSEYCKKKAVEIEEAKKELNAKLEEVEAVRLKRLDVLNNRKQENSKLQSEKNRHSVMVSKLKRKEKDLRKELKKQQKVADQLNAQIERKIAEEARKSEKESIKQGKKVDDVLTKEEKLVSGNFEKNQGRLPWPVEKGIVVGSFGIQPHPVLERVTTNNKGIYIQCPSGSNARSVFEGEVTQCFSIPGSNNAVIIKHGLYRTVYANLTKVNVKVGDKVSLKQTIGKIYSDPDEDNKTVLYFQVWKDKSINNPENWLAH